LVTTVDDHGHCLRTFKYLWARLNGCIIVRHECMLCV
jgi:hypothetical protein